MNLDEIYKPSVWQWRFHLTKRPDEGPPVEILGAGSAGPGKTLGLTMDPIIVQMAEEHLRCVDRRHSHPLHMGESTGWALHLRRTIPQLEQTIQLSHRLFRKIDENAHWDQQKKIWTFSCGYRYQFGHCVESNSWEDYFSSQYTEICFDELIQFEREQYDQLKTRCRSTDPVLRKKLRICSMTNPLMRIEKGVRMQTKDPHWVRNYFVDPPEHPGLVSGNHWIVQPVRMNDGTTVEHYRIYLPAKLSDNPNEQFRRDYEATLRGLPEHIRQAMLYGNWFLVVGAYFSKTWNPQVHVVTPYRIPDEWLKFRSMDWGFKEPGCVHWWAMDEDSNLICFEEYTFIETDVAGVAQAIHQKEKAMGISKGVRSPLTGPADTQLWENRGDIVASKAEVFSKMGISWAQADKRSRQRNAEELSRRLSDQRFGIPSIVFFEGRTPNIVKTLPTIQADPEHPEKLLEGGADHWLDSVLYACAYASRGRIGTSTVRKAYGRDDDEDDQPQPAAKRGQWGYGSRV